MTVSSPRTPNFMFPYWSSYLLANKFEMPSVLLPFYSFLVIIFSNRRKKHKLSLDWEYIQFSSVQLLSRVRFFVTPWIAACQASLSITNSQSSLTFMSIESVMPSSHLILCCPLLLLPPIPPSIRVFSSESTLHMRWPKYWSFSFSIISSMNTQDWSPLEWTGTRS